MRLQLPMHAASTLEPHILQAGRCVLTRATLRMLCGGSNRPRPRHRPSTPRAARARRHSSSCGYPYSPPARLLSRTQCTLSLPRCAACVRTWAWTSLSTPTKRGSRAACPQRCGRRASTAPFTRPPTWACRRSSALGRCGRALRITPKAIGDRRPKTKRSTQASASGLETPRVGSNGRGKSGGGTAARNSCVGAPRASTIGSATTTSSGCPRCAAPYTHRFLRGTARLLRGTARLLRGTAPHQRIVSVALRARCAISSRRRARTGSSYTCSPSARTTRTGQKIRQATFFGDPGHHEKGAHPCRRTRRRLLRWHASL